MFYDTSNENATLGYSGIGFQATQVYTSTPLPVTASQLNFSVNANPPYTDDVAYAFPSHLQPPYTLEWSAAVQQALGNAQTFTLTYVGSNSRRLLQAQIQSNPNFELLYYFPSGLTSNYDALEVAFQRAVTKGLQALASYTWSHSLDYGSTATSFRAIYGNSHFDIRNNFQAGLSWDLPQYQRNRIAKIFLDGWGLDGRVNARTPFPITLTGNALYDASGNLYYSGVNYNPGRSPYLHGKQYPGGKALSSPWLKSVVDAGQVWVESV